jgi:hypothetical protein
MTHKQLIISTWPGGGNNEVSQAARSAFNETVWRQAPPIRRYQDRSLCLLWGNNTDGASVAERGSGGQAIGSKR